MQQPHSSVRLGGVGLAGKDRARVVAIGDMTGWAEAKLYPLANEGIRLITIDDLDENLLTMINPGLVLSPVVSRNFDCMDVAGVLDNARFSGMYRAVTERMSHPKLITSEIRSLYPTLDFDIIQIESDGFHFA